MNSITPNSDAPRIGGLDILRAAAIALVLMSHYMGFVSHAPTFGAIGNVGWAGVDLFFVLSGYLIGNQILSALARGEALSLKTFFARRLLRTLPNYYFVLALYFAFPAALGGSGTASIWKFLTFTQNFGLAYGQTFTHSWSLCIEEQFYLILPLATIALASCKRPVRFGWWVIGGAIAAGMVMRGAAWLAHGYDSFSAEIYYSSLCRFNELLPGVAIAMLKNFDRALFAKILRYGNALLAAGFGVLVGAFYCLQEYAHNPLVTTGGFTLVAAGFGLLTLSALSPSSLLNRWRLPGAASLALWSYAVYLIHKPIFMLAAAHLGQRDAGAPLTIFVVMAAGILGGWILFRCVETPFMLLRARWYPSSPVHRHAAPTAAPIQA
jgi:peptidoglycan/LPS O-acetylase OafA/YrhL